MINIRPVSDLRNKFSEVEKTVVDEGETVFLTKNGYGSMVVMSIEQYSELTTPFIERLKEAEIYSKNTTERYSADEVFSRVRKRIDEE